MVLVLAAAVCLATVPLAGGRLTLLASLDLRAVWAAVAAAAIQIGITTIMPGGSHAVHVALHFGSYALAAWFLVANRGIFGMPVIAAGALLNLVAITVNGGVMPATRFALRVSGLDTSGGFSNSASVHHPHLQWLGDVIPVPGPAPLGNVLSIGDLVIFAGALMLMHRACGSRLRSRGGRRPAPDADEPSFAESYT